MGRKGTTLALTFITLPSNIAILGWWGFISTPCILAFAYYLIWIDSKMPWEKQFRYNK